MLLVADSGSTKTNWLTDKGALFETRGFNPMFDRSDDIFAELVANEAMSAVTPNINTIYYYGAGCSSDERIKIVTDALHRYFPLAQIHVGHDLKAAAYATFDGRPSIACILGTGSNSCQFDGKEIHEVVPALGYILGDEGGGAYFGKKLLTLFLYHQLPSRTYALMADEYKLTKEDIFKRVYNSPRPNVYCAQFAKVLTQSPDREFMELLVEDGFAEFFKYHVSCYENFRQYPVHFVGSLAYHFRNVLQKVADMHQCELGAVDRQPVYNLLKWHEKNG
jgi:glucosamine kinase